MLVVVLLLALDAILHAAVVYRFGMTGNEPPLVFAVIYVALALAVYFAVPYALWTTLVITIVGEGALIANYRNIAHEKTIENVILALNLVVIACTVWLLFF
jgi:hypothetical protein